jgi:hypothetical protein
MIECVRSVVSVRSVADESGRSGRWRMVIMAAVVVKTAQLARGSSGRVPSRRRIPAGWDIVPKARVLRPSDGSGEASFA